MNSNTINLAIYPGHVPIEEPKESSILSEVIRSGSINTTGTRRRTLEECEAISKELFGRDVETMVSYLKRSLKVMDNQDHKKVSGIIEGKEKTGSYSLEDVLEIKDLEVRNHFLMEIVNQANTVFTSEEISKVLRVISGIKDREESSILIEDMISKIPERALEERAEEITKLSECRSRYYISAGKEALILIEIMISKMLERTSEERTEEITKILACLYECRGSYDLAPGRYCEEYFNFIEVIVSPNLPAKEMLGVLKCVLHDSKSRKEMGDSISTSSWSLGFLRLIERMLEQVPISLIEEKYGEVSECLDYLLENKTYFINKLEVYFNLVEFMLSKTENSLAEEKAEALTKVLIHLRDLGGLSMHLPEYKPYSGDYRELLEKVVSQISSLPAQEIFKALTTIFPVKHRHFWDGSVIPMMVYQVLGSLSKEKAEVISKFFLSYLITEQVQVRHYLTTKEYLKMIEKVISMPSCMTFKEMTSLFPWALASLIGFVRGEEEVLQLRELSLTAGLKMGERSFDEKYSEKYGGALSGK